MNYRMLLILAVLIALPWGVRADGSLVVPPGDTVYLNDIADVIIGDIELDSVKVDGGWLVHHGPDTLHFHKSPDTFVVYCIDTVGWRLDHAGHIVRIFNDGRMSTSDTGFFYPNWEQPRVQPICSTIIIGHLTTDADTKQIRKWRVRIAE